MASAICVSNSSCTSAARWSSVSRGANMPVTLSALGMRPANMPRTPPEDERALACADPGVTAALPCDGVVAADAGSICSAGLGRGGASPPGTPLGRCSKGPSGSPSASPASPSRGLNAREKLLPAWRSQEDMAPRSPRCG